VEKMKKKKTITFKFIPKALAIIYILFITIFVFDSESLIGLLIHIIPTLIFLTCFIISVFKPKIGGVLFALAGIGTIIFFKTYKEITGFILISTTSIIIGLMIYLSEKK
jgi:hypothetical protein